MMHTLSHQMHRARTMHTISCVPRRSAAHVAEGAIATVVRAGDQGGGQEKVEAHPISVFYPDDVRVQ